MIQQKVGERIARIRKSKGLTQANMAEELGVTTSTYSKIERGDIDANTSRLAQIAKVLEVNLQEFFGEAVPSHEDKNKYGYASKEEVETLSRLVHALADKIDQLMGLQGEKKEKKAKKKKQNRSI